MDVVEARTRKCEILEFHHVFERHATPNQTSPKSAKGKMYWILDTQKEDIRYGSIKLYIEKKRERTILLGE